MSDTAVFIAATADDLKSNNGLPGDLSALLGGLDDSARVVHTEMMADAAMPERFVNTLSQNGAQITVLPATPDPDSALAAGLALRLQEFICAFPGVNHFLLAALRTDRLCLAAAYLQRAGFQVTVAGPDRAALDRITSFADDRFLWGRTAASPAPRNTRTTSREDAPTDLDPFEILVDEVSKSRNRGNRVLLTSLKQRMRKRIRRFDETRLKDKDGRPMRKFKDFIVDAANRGLIQLIERGNASQVLLPGEDANTAVENDEDDDTPEETPRRRAKEPADLEVDPLLDAVDMIGEPSIGSQDDDEDSDESLEEEAGTDCSETETEEAPEEPLTPEDIDPEEIDEDANPPPLPFLECLETILKTPLTLEELVAALVKKQQDGELPLKTRALKKQLQAAFNNELLETTGESKPLKYTLVDDWRDIVDFL